MEEYERYEARAQSHDADDESPSKEHYLEKLKKVRQTYATSCKEGKMHEAAIVQYLIEEHGFMFAVLALRAVSPKAKALFEKYKSRFTKRR